MLQLACPWASKEFPNWTDLTVACLSPKPPEWREGSTVYLGVGITESLPESLVYTECIVGHVTALLTWNLWQTQCANKVGGACDLKFTHPLSPKPSFLFLCYTSSIVEVFEKFEEKKSCSVSVHRRHGCLGLATEHNLISSFEGCSICCGCAVLAAALFLTVTLELKCLKAIACTKLHAICDHHLPQCGCVVRITEDMTFFAPEWLQKLSLSMNIFLGSMSSDPPTRCMLTHVTLAAPPLNSVLQPVTSSH